MAITLTFDQPGSGIPSGSIDRGRTDIKNTGPVGSPRAHPVTITVGSIPPAALVDVVLLDEPPGANPLLTELAPDTWTLEFDVGCWGPFRVRVTATASGDVVSSVTRRISIRSPGYHIDYPGLAERYDPNATLVPTVPSVELTEMNEGSTNRPLVDFHRQMVEAIEGGGSGGGGVIPDGSITEDKLAPELSDNLLRADGTIPFTASQNAAGRTVANLGLPSANGDAVPLAYLNLSFALSGIRPPCRLVATTPITASNTQVIDSKATVNGDRVLLTAQAASTDNGIFVASDAGAWLRSSDASTAAQIQPGFVVFITDGTEYAESGWILATDAPIALGTSPLTFTRFTGAAQLIAGAGLTKTANTVDVVAHADGSIVVSADAVQVGTLATDAQHGARGGGTQHAAATPTVPGFISAADKTKLDGVAAGAAALASTAPANVGTAAAVGVGTTAARADHVHAHAAQTDGTLHAAVVAAGASGFMTGADKTKLDGISSGAAALASTAPAAVAFSGAVGVGTTAARSDHVHAHGAQTDGTLHANATPAVDGFMSATDKTKLDTVATSAAALTATAPTQITVTTAAVGAATAAAKGDHVHSVSTGAPSALAVAGAQSTGSATSLARSDHQHAMPDVATAAVSGFLSAADKTRLDGMATGAAALTSTAPVNVDNAAAAVGVGTTAARHDHRHNVSIGTPVALIVGGTNAQGSATSLVRSDHTHAMPGLVTTAVDGFASAADKTKLDGVEIGAQVTSFARVQTALGVASSPVSFNSQKLTNVADPTAAQEVATKAYVDAIAQGLDLKASCRLVATTNVTASGVQVIDGVTTSTGDRLLLTSQTAPATNGIYVASGVAWLRAADADVSAEVTSGMYTYITEGTANADSGWALTTNDPIVLGTTALVFTQISGAGQITAGAGMTKSGNTLDVVAHADGSIVVNADSVQIGVIATDVQHGARAGGTTHAAVIAGGASGFITGADKTRLDGMATGAAAVGSTNPVGVDGNASPSAGVATTAARSDHRHVVLTGSPAALTVGGAAADGASNSLARTDHAHAMPGLATTSVDGFLGATDKTRLDGMATNAAAVLSVTPVAVDAGTGSGGSAATASRSDHRHQVSTAAPVALAIGGTNNAGTLFTIARSDHVHAMPALATTSVDGFFSAADKVRLDGMATGSAAVGGTTPANVDNTTGATGVATTAARSDHRHAVNAGNPIALTMGAANAPGTSANLVRADHIHALPAAGTPSSLTLAGTNAQGSAATLALSDHVHALPASSTAPLDNSGVAAAGTSTSIARADHQHPTTWKTSAVALLESVGFNNASPPATVDGVTIQPGDLILVDGTMAPFADDDEPAPLAGELLGIFRSAGSTWTFLETLDPGEVAYVTSRKSLYRSDGSHYFPVYPLANYSQDGLMSAFDYGKLAGIPSNATSPSSTAPTQITVTTAAAGTGTTAARTDHVHSVATAAPVNVSAVGANLVGTSTSLARADHTHDVTTAVPNTLAIGGTNLAGTLTPLARADHVHALPAAGTPVALTTTGANAAGSAGTLARSDHVHALPAAGTPVALTLAGANAAGSAATLALSDHVHALPATAAPVALTVGGGNAAGSAATLPRSDHVHALPAFGTTAGTFCEGNDARLLVNPAVNGFRLAPTTDDSIPADGAFTAVNLAPVAGDLIALYTGSAWVLRAASGVSYTLAGHTAGIPFDMFAAWNGTTVVLEAVNWTSATSRTPAVALAKQNGVWCKSGDTTRRYLGTVRPRSATTYRVQRFNAVSTGSVGIDYFNENLRKQTAIQLTDTVANQAYSTATWRQWAASANAQIDTVAGLPGDPVSITAMASANTSNTTTTISFPLIGIGVNNATPVGARTMEGISRIASAPFDMSTISAAIAVNSTLGVTAYWWLQYGSGNVEFFGINGPAQSGMMALVSY
jgi:hypothetical protein